MVVLNCSKEDCLMLACARLREVTRPGAARARLTLLEDTLTDLLEWLLEDRQLLQLLLLRDRLGGGLALR